MKNCSNRSCPRNNPQPLSEFYNDKVNKTDGKYSKCKTCKNTSTGVWRITNKERYNKSMREYMKKVPAEKRYGSEIKRRYGCSLEQYNEMLSAQGGACAICKGLHNPAEKKGRLYVDHCHSGGQIRALLCGGCNSMLGYAKDDTRVLAEAIAYLVRHKTKE